MGVSVSKRLLMMALLIVTVILSVLKLGLNRIDDPVTVRSIDTSDVIEQTNVQIHEPNSSGVVKSTLHVRPPNQSFPAIRIRKPTTSRVENPTLNMQHSKQSFPAIRIHKAKSSRVENSTINVPPPSNQSFPEDSKNSAIESYQPKGTSVWIYVQEFSEGMATWRISLAEILMVAKRLNATVVEPCIEGGRLRTCHVAKYRLGQVYDLRRLRRFHPHIVSYEDYQTMLAVENPIIITTCLQFPRGTPSPDKVCGNVTNTYQEKVNAPIEKALQYNNGTTVIHIKYYRQGGFLNTKFERKRLVLARFIEPILTDHFEFESQHYDSVDYLLRLMGISNNSHFDVIHWRAERPDINYDDCATKILQARKNMGSKAAVLLSSINLQADRQWFDPDRYNQSDAIQGLNRLLDSGFLKLDQVLDKVQNMIPDQIVVPVWDQIIAQKARRFATCTRGCRQKEHLCGMQFSW
ncbi:hypothetical protein MHU86_5009 [Fragilaria crotonensis]|nr:hypothetical protein MHU86_5009 [Fragilaria crotonensis]